MNNLFAYATSKDSLFYLPGASFFLAAVLILISGYFAARTLTLKANKINTENK